MLESLGQRWHGAWNDDPMHVIAQPGKTVEFAVLAP
jgi:hypothetical protein